MHLYKFSSNKTQRDRLANALLVRQVAGRCHLKSRPEEPWACWNTAHRPYCMRSLWRSDMVRFDIRSSSRHYIPVTCTGVEVPSGLLYYTQSEEIMRVASPRNELRGLIMARNELASYMMRKRTSKSRREGSTTPNNTPFLPSTLDDNYKCSKCYVVDGCMLYRKVLFFTTIEVSTHLSPLGSRRCGRQHK